MNTFLLIPLLCCAFLFPPTGNPLPAIVAPTETKPAVDRPLYRVVIYKKTIPPRNPDEPYVEKHRFIVVDSLGKVTLNDKKSEYSLKASFTQGINKFVASGQVTMKPANNDGPPPKQVEDQKHLVSVWIYFLDDYHREKNVYEDMTSYSWKKEFTDPNFEDYEFYQYFDPADVKTLKELLK